MATVGVFERLRAFVGGLGGDFAGVIGLMIALVVVSIVINELD